MENVNSVKKNQFFFVRSEIFLPITFFGIAYIGSNVGTYSDPSESILMCLILLMHVTDMLAYSV